MRAACEVRSRVVRGCGHSQYSSIAFQTSVVCESDKGGASTAGVGHSQALLAAFNIIRAWVVVPSQIAARGHSQNWVSAFHNNALPEFEVKEPAGHVQGVVLLDQAIWA